MTQLIILACHANFQNQQNPPLLKDELIDSAEFSLEFIIPFLMEEIYSIDNNIYAELEQQDAQLSQIEWELRRKIRFSLTSAESEKLWESLELVNERRAGIAQQQELVHTFSEKGEEID